MRLGSFELTLKWNRKKAEAKAEAVAALVEKAPATLLDVLKTTAHDEIDVDVIKALAEKTDQAGRTQAADFWNERAYGKNFYPVLNVLSAAGLDQSSYDKAFQKAVEKENATWIKAVMHGIGPETASWGLMAQAYGQPRLPGACFKDVLAKTDEASRSFRLAGITQLWNLSALKKTVDAGVSVEALKDAMPVAVKQGDAEKLEYLHTALEKKLDAAGVDAETREAELRSAFFRATRGLQEEQLAAPVASFFESKNRLPTRTYAVRIANSEMKRAL